MKFIHVIFAVLSAYRMVELFLLDRITAKLREKYPTYLWQCSRCLSVWAGAAATIAYLLWPWLNWPFALSWLYFVHNDWVQAHRTKVSGRQFVISLKPSGQWAVARNELNPAELQDIFRTMTAPQPTITQPTSQPVNGKEVH